MKDLIKEDLKLTDAQTSYPLTGMILVYMIFSPIFGWISDHRLVGRRPLLTAAVAFWSAATALAALSKNLAGLVRVVRACVGVCVRRCVGGVSVEYEGETEDGQPNTRQNR